MLGFTPVHSVERQVRQALYPTELCGDPSMRKTVVTTTHKIAPNYSGGDCWSVQDNSGITDTWKHPSQHTFLNCFFCKSVETKALSYQTQQNLWRVLHNAGIGYRKFLST